MPSESRSERLRRTLCAAVLGLSVSAVSPPPPDTPAGAPRLEPPGATQAGAVQTFAVGRAKLTWHLTPDASIRRTRRVEAFRRATEAHLTGGELLVTPMAEPVTLPGGRLRFRVPAELIHALFIGPDGRNYCSDSTVTARPAAARSTGPGER